MKVQMIAVSVFLASCQFPQNSNLLVVPENYSGPLLVVLVAGTERSYQRQGTQNVYTFPESGVLCVASFGNFTKGFRENDAQYTSGKSIPKGDGSDYEDDRFEMRMQKWSVSHSTADGVETILSDPEILFAIGSSEEIRKIETDWLTEEPRFRRQYCRDNDF